MIWYYPAGRNSRPVVNCPKAEVSPLKGTSRHYPARPTSPSVVHCPKAMCPEAEASLLKKTSRCYPTERTSLSVMDCPKANVSLCEKTFLNNPTGRNARPVVTPSWNYSAMQKKIVIKTADTGALAKISHLKKKRKRKRRR